MADPRFQYLSEHGLLKLDQVITSRLGVRYTILAIERSGYVICRSHRHTARIWCDVLESWKLECS